MLNTKHNKKRKVPQFLTLLAVLILAGCGASQSKVLKPAKLKTIKSENEIKNLIDTARSMSDNAFSMVDVDFDAPVASETDSATPGVNAEVDYVNTNEQVAGVNEGDVIKTDGNFVYYAVANENIIRVFERDEEELKHIHDLEVDANISSLYLVGNYLVAVTHRQNNYYPPVASMEPPFVDWVYYPPFVGVNVFSRDTFAEVYSLFIEDTHLLSHRVINETMYLITHKYLYDYTADSRVKLLENDVDITAPYGSIHYFDNSLVYAMTSVTGISFQDRADDIFFTNESFLGGSYNHKHVYMNLDYLFIMDQNYYYVQDGNAWSWRSYAQTTIAQFSLNLAKAGVDYMASGSIKGTTLSQFSADYFNGHLRIATTDITTGRTIKNDTDSFERKVINQLYILKSNAATATFEVVSHLDEGLGKPDELIKSVRFNGNVAYIVTFIQTDPLYVINLEDPQNPVITDEIELPGYDAYQHPWGENKLLGFGYDATNDGFVSGIKLTAYNVSEGNAAVIQTEIVARTGTEITPDRTVYQSASSEGLWDHKALLVSSEKGLFGFPLNVYSSVYTKMGVDTDYESSYRQSYVVYHIDFTEEAPIKRLITVDHPGNPNDENYYNQHGVNRSLYINGSIYFFSPYHLSSYNLTSGFYHNPVAL